MKNLKKEWPFWAVALAAFLACAWAIWLFTSDRPERVEKRLILGDSIYAEKRGGSSVADRLGQAWNGNVYNGALGGTSLARSDRQRLMDEQMDPFSLVALSKAIVSGDFGVQRQIHVELPATEYFDEVKAELETIDFKQTELLLIGYGMNDYQNGVPLEDPKDPGSEYTYAGALRSALKSLQARCPKARIILLTPTYSWYLQVGKSCEEQDWGGGLLEEYVALERSLGAELGVETIDLYHDLYPHEVFEDWEKYTRDGIHPNDAGLELISQKIIAYLEEHPK